MGDEAGGQLEGQKGREIQVRKQAGRWFFLWLGYSPFGLIWAVGQEASARVRSGHAACSLVDPGAVIKLSVPQPLSMRRRMRGGNESLQF